MNGYKTSGGWTDITSEGRNEVVFEGRHKDYGAYQIRQRYPSILYLSFTSTIILIVACAFIPYLFRNMLTASEVKNKDVIANILKVDIQRRVTSPKPITHPPFQHPKINILRKAPPIITRQPIDSIPPLKPNVPAIISNGNSPGKDNQPEVEPQPDPEPYIVPEPEKLYTIVSEMPKFTGGDIEKYLRNNINYPAEESSLGIQGTVYVSFIIEDDGSVSNITLKRGVSNGPGLNKEAMRVLSVMPRWTPGRQDGHPVRVQYMVPIHFKLQ